MKFFFLLLVYTSSVIAIQDNYFSFATPHLLHSHHRGWNRFSNIIRDILIPRDELCRHSITIQQRTQLTSNVHVLLPYRSVLFLACDHKKLPTISLPSQRQWVNLTHDRQVMGVYVDSKYMIPGEKFIINDDHTIYVEEEFESVNIIVESDFFINIHDKRENLDVGQFSYRFFHYKEAFSEYALSVPFSQSILLHMNVLGSMLDASEYPSEQQHLSLPSTFVDVFYCGKERYCNGGPMIGNSTTPYAFEREDYYNDVFMGLHRLITNNSNEELSYIMRIVVNQKSQFSTHIQDTGFFMASGHCYVMSTAKYFRENYVQNELPHELGHTYSLADNSGSDTLNDKLLHYSLRPDLTLTYPWSQTDNYRSFRGSMNNGNGDYTFGHYTRLNRYSTLQAHNTITHARYDMPKKFWSHLRSNIKTILLVCNAQKEFLGFVINSYVELTPLHNENICENCIIISKYTQNRNLVKTIKIPFDRHKPFLALSYDMWLDNNCTFTLAFRGTLKRFYFVHEGKNIPPPYFGIAAHLFTQTHQQKHKNNFMQNLVTKVENFFYNFFSSSV